MPLSRKSSKLIAVNKELLFQNEEKEKRAAELIVANIELAFQNQEKENRAAELAIANIELAFQNHEKEDRAAELVIANRELVSQNKEKEKRTTELAIAYIKLRKSDENLKVYVKGLEEMMYMTSHRVRKPVANIIGLTDLINNTLNSPAQIKKIVKYLNESALSLDVFIKELNAFVSNLEQKTHTDK